MVSSISSSGTSYGVSSPVCGLASVAIQNFIESFSKDNVSDDELTQEANEIMSAVDSDNDNSVSLDELNNYDTSNCSTEMANRINDMARNFKSYDKDGDGALSLVEIKNVIGKKQYSLQELRQMAADANKENSLDQDDKGVNFTASSDTFVQSLINNNYKNENALTETVSYEV